MCNPTNGYKNPFTYTFCLWVDNNQELHNQALKVTEEAMFATEAGCEQVMDGIWTFEQGWKFLLEDYLKNYWENEAENWAFDHDEDSVFPQLLQVALAHIDWLEVAEHFIGEYQDTQEYRDV
jgi:hypothetical protein